LVVTCWSTGCPNREPASVSEKGSLLVFSKIELKWDNFGRLKQDTFLTLINDYPEDVHVKWYFVHGDPPTDAVFSSAPPFTMLERAHPGWEWMNCQLELTEDEPTYISIASGQPMGCQPFTALDPGTPLGRPDPNAPPGHRMMRGFALVFAATTSAEAISWNHLSGSATIVSYVDQEAWEYPAYAFQTDDPQGDIIERHDLARGFDKLLLDFYAVGSTAFSRPDLGTTVMLDTELTLFPVDADLRQDPAGRGPVTTKAKFDIWNENEDFLSGTTRCITCWDSALLSTYDPPNNFLIENLHTDKGKARIDGVESEVCENCEWIRVCGDEACEWIEVCEFESQDVSLLGVALKVTSFSGATTGRALAGNTLVGQGTEKVTIKTDPIDGPDLLTATPAPEMPGQLDETAVSPVSRSRVDDERAAPPGKQ
jgi:hypothetical protein